MERAQLKSALGPSKNRSRKVDAQAKRISKYFPQSVILNSAVLASLKTSSSSMVLPNPQMFGPKGLDHEKDSEPPTLLRYRAENETLRTPCIRMGFLRLTH